MSTEDPRIQSMLAGIDEGDTELRNHIERNAASIIAVAENFKSNTEKAKNAVNNVIDKFESSGYTTEAFDIRNSPFVSGVDSLNSNVTNGDLRTIRNEVNDIKGQLGTLKGQLTDFENSFKITGDAPASLEGGRNSPRGALSRLESQAALMASSYSPRA